MPRIYFARFAGFALHKPSEEGLLSRGARRLVSFGDESAAAVVGYWTARREGRLQVQPRNQRKRKVGLDADSSRLV